MKHVWIRLLSLTLCLALLPTLGACNLSGEVPTTESTPTDKPIKTTVTEAEWVAMFDGSCFNNVTAETRLTRLDGIDTLLSIKISPTATLTQVQFSNQSGILNTQTEYASLVADGTRVCSQNGIGEDWICNITQEPLFNGTSLIKDTHNDFSALFSAFTYDEATKSYKADTLTLTYDVLLSDVELRVQDGKVIEITYTESGVTFTTTFSDYGTTVIQAPTGIQ